MKSVFKVSLAALTLAFAVSSHAANKTLVVATDTALSRSNLSKAINMSGLTLTCGRLSPKS